MTKIPMTEYGAAKLREELQHLKTVARPKVINAISEARAHGDLKENAEYHAAREQQGFIEGRIAEIDAKLAYAQIINITQFENTGKVIFGATITLINIENETQVTYQIVGEDEADIQINKISVTSPIARALIGKMKGDEVEVKTPSGTVTYELIDVKYI